MSESRSLHDEHVDWIIWCHQVGEPPFEVAAVGRPDLPDPPEINGYVPDVYSLKGGGKILLIDVETEESFLSENERCRRRRDAFKLWEAEDPENRAFRLGIAASEEKGNPNLHTNWEWRFLLDDFGMPM